MDNYFSSHQEYHSEKSHPQWNHNMNALDEHIVDSLLVDDQVEQTKETYKPMAAEESEGIGNAVNILDCIYNADKKNVEKSPQSDPSPQKKNV